MFKKISSSMQFPLWAQEDSRWRRLVIYDNLLDGKFYDHLTRCFDDEQELDGTMIPLIKRRPSCQYRLPRYTSRWVAKKLFVGRHVPKVRSKDKAVEEWVRELLTGSKIWPVMYEAAYRGSVGSVGITFRLDGEKMALKVWRGVWCSPQFDDFGELANLRVHYITSASDLAAIGISVVELDKRYWFIRDYGPQTEVTYRPELENDWNPVTGFREEGRSLAQLNDRVIVHNLGFVPAVWIANPGGTGVDGPALWEDAIPDNIEIDYLLSQASRGAKYNCAPQLVTIGQVLNAVDDTPTRGPTQFLAFQAGHKDESGNTIDGGDAKLLEMAGRGVEITLKIVETLHKHAFEQIGIIQKDPGEMPGPLSGRAMEFLDEDAHDTVMQWRSTYGDGGALALISKILRAKDPEFKTSGLWLQWPRVYLPTPNDLLQIVQALVMAATPSAVQGAKTGEDGSVPIMAPLLDSEIAREYLEANMDLGILDDTDEGANPGAGGGEPAPDEGGKGVQQDGFWRIFPPIRVKA